MAEAEVKCADCSGRKWVSEDLPDGSSVAKRCHCYRGGNPASRLVAIGVMPEEVKRALLPIDRQVAEKTDAVLALAAKAGRPGSLLIMGDVGRGKTLLAVRLLLRVAEKHPKVTLGYSFLPRLFLDIKSTFGRGERRDGPVKTEMD